jgi:hypothetical protein
MSSIKREREREREKREERGKRWLKKIENKKFL